MSGAREIRGGAWSRRCAAALAGAATLAMVALLCAPASHARAVQQPACASYPTPGTVAPSSTRLPSWLTAEYSVLATPHRADDDIHATQVTTSLTAAGLVLNRAQYLGRAAFGGRIYLIPAEHLLAFKLAPLRCFPASEQSLERELAPQLKQQYRHWALCVVVLDSTGSSPTCGAANTDPEALLYAAGTPGFGLVPDGVPYVTLSYLTAPPRTLRVQRNFYLVTDVKQSAAPCAAQWQLATGVITKTFAGCDYVPLLQPQLYEYRGYVVSTLATLKSQVATLASDIDAGNLAQAESDWLTAHLTWLDIGQDDGPYSAYGNLGNALDGTAEGDVGTTSSPDFTGFHRVEMDLWQDDDLSAAATDVAELQKILDQIIAVKPMAAFPDTANGIANWILRPHETLEDAIRDTLSGDDDYGSGTGIASVTADVTATREYLTVLAPVLDPLSPRLIPHARAELTRLDDDCVATQVNGQWVGVSALPEREREQIDSDAAAAVLTLDQIPDILTTVGHGAPST